MPFAVFGLFHNPVYFRKPTVVQITVVHIRGPVLAFSLFEGPYFTLSGKYLSAYFYAPARRLTSCVFAVVVEPRVCIHSRLLHRGARDQMGFHGGAGLN